ncbi:MAG: hypothetical protein Q7S00_04065, partial [bacterium]|nr:hypothetical protein [bacterium]
MKKNLFALFVVGFCLTITACASNYNSRAQSAHQAYFRGDYDRALQKIDSIKVSPRDRLLYLLDKGMILQGAGRYKESNQILTQAEDLSEELSIKSVSRETASTFWSEEGRDYAGDKEERTMIPVVRMLNYLMMEDWDGALVEVRHTLTLVEKIYANRESFENGFTTYLSGILWESLGYLNDALIDYKKLGKTELPYYANDLQNLGRRLELAVSLPPSGSPAWDKTKDYRQKKGELIVIAPVGRAPIYISEGGSIGYYTVMVPTIAEFSPSVTSVRVLVNQTEVGKTVSFYKTVEGMRKGLKERRKRTLARKVIKMTTQTGLYTTGAILMSDDDSIGKQLAGLGLEFLSFSMSAADKADERSWRTLPA